jgi:hypothetical protein
MAEENKTDVEAEESQPNNAENKRGRQDGRELDCTESRRKTTQLRRQTVKRTGPEEKSQADWKAGRYEEEDAGKIE